MQDFNYLFSNCMELTLELSCIKNPPANTLQDEWEKNREPLMAFLEKSGRAARGVVHLHLDFYLLTDKYKRHSRAIY